MALTMLLSFVGVFATDTEALNENFVLVKSIETNLQNNVVLKKELFIPSKTLNARAGFAGDKTVKVKTSVVKDGNTQAVISAQATFFSTLGSNVCYMKNYYYTVEKTSQFADFHSISDSAEIDWSGGGSLPHYSRYVVEFGIDGWWLETNYSAMYVRCTSSGITSSSGNQTVRGNLNKNQYLLGDVIIEF